MRVVPIFAGNTKIEECALWSVVYPEHGESADNIFRQLFNNWNDTEYVRGFIKDHESELKHPIWKGITKDEALEQVLDEVEDFEAELKAVESKQPGFENVTLDDIFEPLHKDEFRHRRRNESHRKARPDFSTPMLRIYAIKLSDGCFIVTGGGIKLTNSMKEAELEGEVSKIERVQDYLKREGISSREGLIEGLTD